MRGGRRGRAERVSGMRGVGEVVDVSGVWYAGHGRGKEKECQAGVVVSQVQPRSGELVQDHQPPRRAKVREMSRSCWLDWHPSQPHPFDPEPRIALKQQQQYRSVGCPLSRVLIGWSPCRPFPYRSGNLNAVRQSDHKLATSFERII